MRTRVRVRAHARAYPATGAPPYRAAAGRRWLAFAMGRHGRLGAGSPVRRLDDLLVALVLASPARPFPGA